MEKILLHNSEQGLGTKDNKEQSLICSVKHVKDIMPTVTAEIRDAARKIKPIDGCSVYIVIAVGAEEFWGPNAWGDAFPEGGLAHKGKDYGYETFYDARVYVKHKVDKNRVVGDVLCSAYNHDMHRVELLLKIDHNKLRKIGYSDFADALEQGELPMVSMGTRTPYDVCSICGHKRTAFSDKCEHAKKYLNSFLPDGSHVFLRTPQPAFHDISIVNVGADLSARGLQKVAELSKKPKGLKMDSATLYAMLQQKAGQKPSKDSDSLSKAVIAKMPVIQSFDESGIHLPMQQMAKNHSAKDILETTAGMGIILSPEEFYFLALIKKNPEKAVQILNGTIKPDISAKPSDKPLLKKGSIDRVLYSSIMHYIPYRSIFAIGTELNKKAMQQFPPKGDRLQCADYADENIAPLYRRYRNDLIELYLDKNAAMPGNISEYLVKHGVMPKAVTLGLVGLPLLGLLGAHWLKKEDRGDTKLNFFQNLFAHYPMVTAAVISSLVALKYGKTG